MVKIEFNNMVGTQARTLLARYLGKHSNGWDIRGLSKRNLWVNEFEAFKGNMKVYGDFEKCVYATSQKAYEEFIKSFPFVEWDYKDIEIKL